MDPGGKRLRAERKPERDVVGDRSRIELALNTATAQQRAKLRGECQCPAGGRPVEGVRADRIRDQHDATLFRVDDRRAVGALEVPGEIDPEPAIQRANQRAVQTSSCVGHLKLRRDVSGVVQIAVKENLNPLSGLELSRRLQHAKVRAADCPLALRVDQRFRPKRPRRAGEHVAERCLQRVCAV